MAALNFAALKYSVEISYHHLEPGHTHNEGDSIHATIERHDRHQEIYTKVEYLERLRTAKQEPPPHRVSDMSQEMIYDLKSLVKKQTWAKDLNNQQIKWSKVRAIEVDPTKTGMFFKNQYDDDFTALKTNAKKGHPVNVAMYPLTPAYTALIKLRPLKQKHLCQLCTKGAIPEKYHPFYQQLIATSPRMRLQRYRSKRLN